VNLYGFVSNDGVNRWDLLGNQEEGFPENPDRPIDKKIDPNTYNCAALAFRTFKSLIKAETEKILSSQCKKLQSCDDKCTDPDYCVKAYFWTYTVIVRYWELDEEGKVTPRGKVGDPKAGEFHIVGGKSGENGEDAANACSTQIDKGFDVNPRTGGLTGHPSDFRPRTTEADVERSGKKYRKIVRYQNLTESCYCCPEEIKMPVRVPHKIVD